MSAITADPLWIAEKVPESIVAAGAAVRAAWGLPAAAVGAKGDTAHRSGYHRSRAWVLGSSFSANGTGDYSVRYAPDKTGGDDDWVCALDITPGSVERMIAASKRLDTALRAEMLPTVREFYGNINGDKIVDGWDNLLDRAVTSDSSHLWHIHISFYRSTADRDHSDVVATILGASMALPIDTLYLKLIYENWAPTAADWARAGGDPAVYAQLEKAGSGVNVLAQRISQIGADVAALRVESGSVGLTDAQVAAIADQVAAATDGRLAALEAQVALLVAAGRAAGRALE